MAEMPPKARKSYQKQLAVLKTRVPKRPDEEIGKEIELFGKDWNMSGHFTARSFKCYVTKFDPDKDWEKKDIPQVCATAHKKRTVFVTTLIACFCTGFAFCEVPPRFLH